MTLLSEIKSNKDDSFPHSKLIKLYFDTGLDSASAFDISNLKDKFSATFVELLNRKHRYFSIFVISAILISVISLIAVFTFKVKTIPIYYIFVLLTSFCFLMSKTNSTNSRIQHEIDLYTLISDFSFPLTVMIEVPSPKSIESMCNTWSEINSFRLECIKLKGYVSVGDALVMSEMARRLNNS